MLQQINKAVESTNPNHKVLKTKTSQCYNSQINNKEGKTFKWSENTN